MELSPLLFNFIQTIFIINHTYNMTSFQRFQRHQRSQKQSEPGGSKTEEDYITTKIRQLITFSDKEIVFRHNQQTQTLTSSLKIMNMSGFRIHFKVRSNNPSKYRVTPYEQIVQDQQQKIISFEYQNSRQNGSGMKKDKNTKDKFQIVWGKLSNNPGERSVLSESKVFKVEIIQVPEHQFTSKNSSRDEIGYYDENPGGGMPPYLKQMETNYPNEGASALQHHQSSSETLLRKNIIIGVSVISFLLGFLLT